MPATTQLAEYDKLKTKLHASIARKRELDDELALLEDEIFAKESEYFSDCAYGNIIKGFDQFNKNTPANAVLTAKRKFAFTDDDRIFLLSSATYIRHLKRTQGNAAVAHLGIPASMGKMVDEDDLIDDAGDGKKRK